MPDPRGDQLRLTRPRHDTYWFFLVGVDACLQHICSAATYARNASAHSAVSPSTHACMRCFISSIWPRKIAVLATGARAARPPAMLQSAAQAQQQRVFPRLALTTHSTLPSRPIHKGVSVLQRSCRRSRAFQPAHKFCTERLLGARVAAAAEQQTASMAAEVDVKSDVPIQELVDLAVVWACQHGLVSVCLHLNLLATLHPSFEGRIANIARLCVVTDADQVNSHHSHQLRHLMCKYTSLPGAINASSAQTTAIKCCC